MSYKSYSASERRGILVIAIIALLITGFGIWLSFRNNGLRNDDPEVREMKEWIDTIHYESSKSSVRQNTKSKKEPKIKKSKQQKEYRKRSPLDEPV